MMLSKNKLNEILKVDPLNSKANELLAYILANEGELAKAHDLLIIANNDKNSSAESNYYLGVSYLKKNDYEKAINYIQLSLSKNGYFYEGLINLAIAYGNLKEYKKSEEIFSKSIKLYPEKKYVPYINIGKLKSKQKEYDQSIYYFNKALLIDQKSEEALINLSTVYFDLENYHEALNILYQTININKNNEKAVINIAASLNMMERYSESIDWSEKILSNSTNDLALINLAESLSGLKEYSKSLEIYNQISKSGENYIKVINNKGVIFDKLGKYEDALLCFDEIIKINNLNEDALSNKAKILNEIHNYVEALICIDKAIAINFNRINLHLGKAFILFNMGDYENAWIEYEWRNKKNSGKNEKIEKIKEIAQWDGNRTDKKIIIWGEQGLGDQILFCSVLKEIVQLNIKPTVIISNKMINVFSQSIQGCRFISINDNINLSEYDYQISIISLQKFFRKKLSDFNKIKIPYLSYSKNSSIQICNEDAKIICGITWKSFSKELGNEKSIPLDDFNIILNKDNIKFIDIQYYPPKVNEDLRVNKFKIVKIVNANFYENFELLVQIIKQCDIIITCSNSTAHLAGAMGKKTYLLLPKNKGRHWYWKHVNGISIFYPTITVLEQENVGSWVEPIKKLNKIFENLN